MLFPYRPYQMVIANVTTKRMADASILALLKVLEKPEIPLTTTPADILNQFAGYASKIQMGNSKKMKDVTVDQVENKLDKLISEVESKKMESAIGGINFN